MILVSSFQLRIFSDTMIHVFQFVSIGSCPVPGRYLEQSGCCSLKVFISPEMMSPSSLTLSQKCALVFLPS